MNVKYVVQVDYAENVRDIFREDLFHELNYEGLDSSIQDWTFNYTQNGFSFELFFEEKQVPGVLKEHFINHLSSQGIVLLEQQVTVRKIT